MNKNKDMDFTEFLETLHEEGLMTYGITYYENLEHLREIRKHKDMWQWFKKNYSYYLVGVKEKQGNWTIKNFIDIAEQQYFPKEVDLEEQLIKTYNNSIEIIEKIKKLINV